MSNLVRQVQLALQKRGWKKPRQHVYLECVMCPKEGCEFPNEVITSQETVFCCEFCGEVSELKGLQVSRAYVDDYGHPLGWRDEEVL